MALVQNVKLKVTAADDYEWLINEDTGEIIVEGANIATEDILYALGYRYVIEIDAPED